MLFSCQKGEPYADIEVIGHAGMGLDMSNSIYHENSLEGIELALSISGSDGVEIDVQQDKDGTLWLFHDESLDEATTTTGCIANKSTTELENVRYKSLHKEQLLKLSELNFDKFQYKSLFLDLRFYQSCSKSYADGLKFKNALLDLQIQTIDNLYLIIPSATYLPVFEADFRVLYANDNFEDCFYVLNQDSLIEGIVIRNQNINSSQLETLKSLEKRVYIFEMRSPKGIKSALKKYPTGIITDDLRAAIIQRRK
jgi:hypothetical protein